MDLNVKKLGQVFTPSHFVKLSLDFCGYNDTDAIIQKHVIDNSCGDGAFLCEIVKRYIKAYIKKYNNTLYLKEHLETYIHGIEIDYTVYMECINNLNSIVKSYILDKVEWDILNTSALSVLKFDNMMDFVIGNPPYVRVHNFDNNYGQFKSFDFAKNGMTDLYLVFYELGLKMLNSKGRLCYITPSSWLSSNSGKTLREVIVEKKYNTSIIDFKHEQLFKGITTYSAITLIDTYSLDDFVSIYNYNENNIEFSKRYDKEAFFNSEKPLYKKYITVKNGFATLNDKLFINDNIPNSNFCIQVYKATKSLFKKCFFPYTSDGTLIPLETIKKEEKLFQYINDMYVEQNKDIPIDVFYQFGRSQAIKDVFKNKISVSNIIKTKKDLKPCVIPSGVGIYSGLYITKNTEIDNEVIFDILNSDELFEYITNIRKYKSSGYYTFSSKDLELFINTKISDYEK